jgi:hypothetical protein
MNPIKLSKLEYNFPSLRTRVTHHKAFQLFNQQVEYDHNKMVVTLLGNSMGESVS